MTVLRAVGRSSLALMFIGAALMYVLPAGATTEYGSGEQGSALIAPYDVTGNNETVLRIVNAGPDDQPIHIIRVCHGVKFVDNNCRKTDFSVTLTPNETFVLNVGEDTTNPGPNCDFGYVMAYAETSFFDKIPELYNHLYGDVTITSLSGGRRSGEAPMAGVRCVVPDNGQPDVPTECSDLPAGQQAGRLKFDGVNFERLHSKLKSTFRAGISATRQSVIYLATIDIVAGALEDDPTLIVYDRFSQDEVPASGSLEYLCSARLETSDQAVVPILHQNSVGTPNGTIKLRSGNTPTDAIMGWVLREAGKGKRSMRAMWINEKSSTAEVTTSFTDL